MATAFIDWLADMGLADDTEELLQRMAMVGLETHFDLAFAFSTPEEAAEYGLRDLWVLARPGGMATATRRVHTLQREQCARPAPISPQLARGGGRRQGCPHYGPPWCSADSSGQVPGRQLGAPVSRPARLKGGSTPERDRFLDPCRDIERRMAAAEAVIADAAWLDVSRKGDLVET